MRGEGCVLVYVYVCVYVRACMYERSEEGTEIAWNDTKCE